MDAAEIKLVKLLVSLATAVLLVVDEMLRRRGSADRFRGARNSTLVALALVGALGWWNFFEFGARGFLQGGDMYHYYLGGKYFSELGYTRLYRCTAVAEATLLPPQHLQGRLIRDLETNRLVPIESAIREPERCTSHFEPERWSEFRRDLAWFLMRIKPAQWHQITTDHGPNAPPVWGVLGISLANLLDVSVPSIALASRIDPILQLLMWSAVAWGFGWRVLCVALVFWGTNGLGEFNFLGGGYLRQDWLCVTVAGLCALRRQKHLAAGALLATAALLRIFPSLLILTLGLGTLFAIWKSRSVVPPRAYIRFAAGAAIAVAILVPSSFATSGLDGWRGFAENIRLHAETPGQNQLGLVTLASYDPANPPPRDASPRERERWVQGRQETLAANWWTVLACWALYVVLLIRAAGRAPDWVVAALGVGSVFMFLEIAGYYYSMLIAFALLHERDPLAGPAICAFSAMSLLLSGSGSSDELTFAHAGMGALLLPLVLLTTWRAGNPTVSDAATAERALEPEPAPKGPGGEARRTRPEHAGVATSASSRIVIALACALLVFGLVRATQLAWICDDAFVSLQYAANLVAGHGLVYNPGELVEGYTNLLWTLALAVALRVGAPDVASAQWLGIACYAALALLLLAASWRRHRREGVAFLPVAAGVVLVSPDFHEWASGGLETSMFALLALAGALLARGAGDSDRRAILAGVAFSLLTLTRPDGLLFAGAAAAGLALVHRRLRAPLLLAAPVVVTVVVWGAVKLGTYGELLPTAFYSKSVLRPYYAQGLVYLGLYLAKNWFLPLVLVAVVLRRRRLSIGWDARDASSLVLAAGAGLYLFYVVHVGGDFMFARRILPAVPLLLLALEELLLRGVAGRARFGVAAACVAAAALPYPVFDESTVRIRGVADERRFYPPSAIEKRKRQAETVGRALRDTGARVMFEGGMCAFGYYSRLPYLAEMTGLTHYSLARLPIEERGWIGHEKRPTDAWLTENDIHFIVSHRFPPVARPRGGDTSNLIFFGDVAVARIHRYDDSIMDSLRAVPGLAFVPIEALLERRREEVLRATPSRAQQILAQLERYYFDGAGERGREAASELRALVATRVRGS